MSRLDLLRRRQLAGLCLLLLIAAGAHANQRSLLVLGDSISAAYGMSLEQGWVSLLQSELAESHPGVAVVNASISGETSGGALRRLPDLLQRHQPDLVVIELGGNDGLRGHPIRSLRENLTALATLSKDAGARVVIIPMQIPPNYGRRYTDQFRDTFAEVAKATGSLLTPFILDGIAGNPQLMQGDGIHPKDTAQPAMLDHVLPTVTEALE